MTITTYERVNFNVFYGILLLIIALIPFDFYRIGIPFFEEMQVFLVALLTLTWLLDFNYKRKYDTFIKNGRSKLLLVFYLLYFSYVLGMFYTDNLEAGFSILERKTLLLLSPLLFLTFNEYLFTPKRQKILFYTFVFSCLLYVLLMFGIAINNFARTGDWFYFFYGKLSLWKSPTYISIFLVFSNTIIYYYAFISSETSKKEKRILLSVLFLNLVYIILLQSKAAILIQFILLILFVVYIYLYGEKIKKMLYVMLFPILIMVVLFLALPQQANRIDYAVREFKNSELLTEGSTGVRLMVWKSSLKLFKDKPIFGYGLGDAQDSLNELIAKNDTINWSYFPHSHNQYLQIMLQLGLVGLIAFLSIFYVSIRVCFSGSGKGFLLLFFIIPLMLDMLTDVFTENQSVIFFIYFFLPVLYFIVTSEKKLKEP